MVQGHARVIAALHLNLPPATLFVGPHSVGRWTTAEHLRWHFGVHPDDLMRVRDLDVAAANAVRQFTLTRPANSPFKLVIIDLYKSTRAAQVALTTVLEDPKYARVIVIAQPNEVLPGVMSRAVPFWFSFLMPSEVAAVLEEKMSFSEERAKDLASRAGGQISNALKLAEADDQLTLVRAALRAIRGRDEAALNELAPKWTDETTAWLVQWCNENLSQQWRVFDHEDYVDGPSLPLRILLTLAPRVRPRLVVRSQLMDILRGE